MSARPLWLSPSLAAVPDGGIPAFETKFAVPVEAAAAVEGWVAERLARDPHSDPVRNGYRITSVYYDTPAFDVFHRRPGFDVHKYRVRRYGTEPVAQLERKSKKDGRVWKCRATAPLAALDHPPAAWGVSWFAQELADLRLRPVCTVTYDRSAFVGAGPTGPVRVTFDRSAVGRSADGVSLAPVADGVPLLADEVVVEFKYLAALPPLFKEAIEVHRLAPTGLSKYRRCARTTGLAAEECFARSASGD
jgi:hypothetical protein